MHDNQKYVFTKTDIFKLVFSSITYSKSFFAYPKKTRNPYNNIPFEKSNLYQIYFFLKERITLVPVLLERYFLCDFDLDRFESENQYLLREWQIEDFMRDCMENLDKSCDYIREMLLYVYYQGILVVHPDFPKKKLVEIMKPYLHLYLEGEYSLDNIIAAQSRDKLREKLIAFYRFNPCFGRINHGSKTDADKKRLRTFNESHIPFHTIANV